MTSVLRHLAEYVCWLSYADIPDEVVGKTRTVVLHDLAVALGGSQSDAGQLAFEVIRDDLGPLGTSTVVGQRARASVLEAALANAVMMAALGLDDSLVPSCVHAGALVVPVVLALAEQHGSSGREVITSIVAAYDVLGRVAGARWTWGEDGRDPTHVFGALGVAAAAAKLLRLDLEQTYSALAHAATLGPTGGVAGAFVGGMVCRQGLTAAQLGRARAPVPCEPATSPVCTLDTLGKDFDIMAAVLRTEPYSELNLVPVRLLKLILAEHRFGADDVERITVLRPRQLACVPHVHARTSFDDRRVAAASLPFALAATLVDGEPTAARLDDRCEAHLLEQVGKVHLELVDQPDLSRHRVEVGTRQARTRGASGDRLDLTDPDPLPLLLTQAGPYIGTEKARTLAAHVGALEYAPSVEIIAACLRP